MHFIDEAKIYVKAGDGGDGSHAMRREDNVPRGGPSGGDGGHGGSIVFIADPNLSTLMDFKYRRHYRAERGENGRDKDQYGAGGADMEVRVPVGTVVYDDDTQAMLADFVQAGDRFIVAKGGAGGLGNIHFKTPWNQAPRTAHPGSPGEERNLRMELKLLADVGLLGFPNVGKSTFISVVSRAKPKIADYPFTTLVPNLGVVVVDDERAFVIADIPGLIEGAADGAGLGHQFLRHVERCRALLHIVEDNPNGAEGRNPIDDYKIINAELKKYAPELAKKKQLVVLNKIDVTGQEKSPTDWKKAFKKLGVEMHTMSAAGRQGTTEILELLWKLIQEAK